ncbi:zinc carboxypeptidase-like [Anticarsia gemmatalis]|uniref:zinc carboxypeptidase-like n=1 Tax=Anticarsia gemmatalis TaxID=129554 RepID=UPI003F771143
MELKYLIISLTLVITVSAEKKSYEGYRLYNVVPKDDAAVDILKDVQRRGLGEFWEDEFGVNHTVKVMVPPGKVADYNNYVKTGNIVSKEVIADIQRVIDDQLKPALNRFSQSYLSYSWTEYHNLDRLNAWLDELAKNHPGIVTTVTMGKSVLENDIKGIIINYNPERENPLIGVLEGTLHAREWISTATITWIIKEFLTSTDPAIRALAENFEWHIFPVVNPDGYRYTFTTNRMWRKNRSPANITSCASAGVEDDMSSGVDLNRNFGFEWMTVGASQDPCSNLFAGPGPFSEPESRAIRDYVLRLKDKGEIIYYIAIHSYTQLIVVPYSHVSLDDSLLSGNYGDMYEVAIRGADALKRRFGTEYRVGLSADVMYKMSGTSFDWVKYAANVPITYLLELRDLGEFGFLLPANQIIPTGLETMDALVEMDRTTRNLGYYQYRSSGVSAVCSVVVVMFGVIVALFG